jgi:hypothetical protein
MISLSNKRSTTFHHNTLKHKTRVIATYKKEKKSLRTINRKLGEIPNEYILNKSLSINVKPTSSSFLVNCITHIKNHTRNWNKYLTEHRGVKIPKLHITNSSLNNVQRIYPHENFTIPNCNEEWSTNNYNTYKEQSRLSYASFKIPDGFCWVFLLNLTSEDRINLINHGLYYPTLNQLHPLIVTYGFNQKLLLGKMSKNNEEKKAVFHIEECSHGPSTATKLWKSMIEIELKLGFKIYIGGYILWWGDNERFKLPKPIIVKNDYDIDMNKDDIFQSPKTLIELHNIEESNLVSLGCLGKCDDINCNRISRGAIVEYKDDILNNISFMCATHLYIPRCVHENISFTKEKRKIYFDFLTNRWRGRMIYSIIKPPKIISKSNVLIKNKKENIEEKLNKILSIDNIVECRVIKSLYDDSIYNNQLKTTINSLYLFGKDSYWCNIISKRAIIFLTNALKDLYIINKYENIKPNYQSVDELTTTMVFEGFLGHYSCSCIIEEDIRNYSWFEKIKTKYIKTFIKFCSDKYKSLNI